MAVVVPLISVLVVQLLRGGRFVANFDFAAQELAVQEANHGSRLLGPYSHFFWNHPGPLLFYVVVPWYRALGSNGGLALVVSRLTFDAICAALIVILVGDVLGRAAAWGATVGVAWFELRVGLAWFRNPWNPYAVVLPLALALIAGAALLDGRRARSRLLVLVVAGSFAVQSHIGTSALVALAVAFGLVGFVRSARHRERKAVAIDAGLALGTAIACWALPIWQQLTADHGNLGAIVNFFTHTTQRRPGFATVVHAVTAAMTLPASHMGDRLGAEPLTGIPRITALWWLILALLVGVAIVAAVSWWRAGLAVGGALGWTVAIGYGLAVFAGLQIRGAVGPYLFAPDLALGLIAWITVGCFATTLLVRRVRQPIVTALVAAVGLALLVSAAFVGHDAFDPARRSFENRLVADAAPGIRQVCRANRPVNLVSRSAIWWDELSVAAAIGECAPDVSVDKRFAYIVTVDRTKRLSDALTVRLETRRVPLEPGWRRLWSDAHASLDVDEATP